MGLAFVAGARICAHRRAPAAAYFLVVEPVVVVDVFFECRRWCFFVFFVPVVAFAVLPPVVAVVVVPVGVVWPLADCANAVPLASIAASAQAEIR
jgi:hypothetical protein